MEFTQIKENWDCTREEWENWQWQLKNSITSVEELKEIFSISEENLKDINEATEIFPMSITPYYASLIDFENDQCPIKKQAVPGKEELQNTGYEMEDPLHEEKDSPVEGLTHRYPDRVLLLVANQCSMFCRHCTRKRKVGEEKQTINQNQIEQGIDYIKNNPQIRDVLLSGGDPLLLGEEELKNIINQLFQISHVEIVRIGSRVPVVLPQRINSSLINMLEEMVNKHGSLWINTHFNHEKEITPRSEKALSRLANTGIPLGNQTVLLRDVNDCPILMKNLMHKLVQNRVRPYYLYQCDLSRGIEHFRTPISKGIEIMEHLIGHTSGMAVPRFVVDAPGGGGKIPLSPNYLLSSSNRKTILRNFEGNISVYTEPKNQESNCPPDCNVCDNPLIKQKNEEKEIGLEQLFSEDNNTISLNNEERNYGKRKNT